VILYFFNIRMECEKKFDGIFYSAAFNVTTTMRPLYKSMIVPLLPRFVGLYEYK
jgi:hypothetical protein